MIACISLLANLTSATLALMRRTRLAVAIVIAVLTSATAWAENNVSYRDANNAQQTATNVNMLNENSLELNTGWYVADDNLTIFSRVSVSGDVKLILKDGVTLYITKGITVEGDNSLTIYGQTGGTGELVINEVTEHYAGIGAAAGSGKSCGAVTICGGVVNVTGGSLACDIGGLCGFFRENSGGGTITISGGQVTTGGSYGIGGMSPSFSMDATVILGYNRPTDYINISSLSLTSSVTIAKGKMLTDDTNIYTSETDLATFRSLNGKTLRPYSILTVSYLDINGEEQQNYNSISLTGTETTLDSGWYVADGTINFDQHISVMGDIHIILKDGAVVNVGSEGSPIDGYGIGDNRGDNSANHSISIYGQSTGTNNGQLNVYSTKSCIWAFNGDINCSSARITAFSSESYSIWALNYNEPGSGNLNLKDATVNATGTYGLYAQRGNLSIDGGKVTASGTYGIFTNNSDVTIIDGEVTVIGSNAGIYAEQSQSSSQGGSITISGGKVTANGYNNMGIDANSVTISGGEVTATGNIYGIYARNGDVAISGGQVYATGTASSYHKGIYASKSITLGWTRSTDFIYADCYGVKYGSISIAGGKTFIDEDNTTYSGNIAFENDACALDGKELYPPISDDVAYLDMNGEQKSCLSYIPLTGSETTLAPNWYVADGTINFDHHVSVAGDVHIILKDGAVVNVGTAENPIDGYGIGDDSANHSISIYGQSTGAGNGLLNAYSTKSCIWAFNGDFNCSSARITGLSSNAYTIWTLDYNEPGLGNLNLKDATINVTGVYGLYAQKGNLSIDGGKVTATGSASNYGIFANNSDVTIINGEVIATGGHAGIYAENGSVTISGGKVTADGYNHMGIDAISVTISGGEVTATGSIYGIYAQNGDVTISGGQVHATGTASSYNKGIYAFGNIALGWTSSTDFILANGYGARYGKISIAEDQTFIDEDGTAYSGTIVFENETTALDGKTLRPLLVLADNADNTAIISQFNGQTYNVTLAGRTLFKDGYWNTLCLPFGVVLSGSPLDGAEARELTSASIEGSTLNLSFSDPVDELVAGTPYIIKWGNSEGSDSSENSEYSEYSENSENAIIVSPVFMGVAIDKTLCPYDSGEAEGDGRVRFLGTYAATTFGAEDRSILFVGDANKLYYPLIGASIKAQRAYFKIGPDGNPANARQLTAFNIDFGDGEASGIIEAEATSIPTDVPTRGLSLSTLHSSLSEWYTLDGRRLEGRPSAKGLYIHGGRKVAVK